ncbi:MAG: hypothetical protein CSA75_03170 [Sorangium cellulosum]|nr:MAG: hypothetical protein CSA75_03170 [Sorangium cellulosum]
MAVLAVHSASGCALGEGAGEVKSERLGIEGCWDGPYNMQPDFFGGVPFRESFHIRIQKSGDLQEMSDGLSILVRDVHLIRGDKGNPSLMGVPLKVGLPPEVTPPGVAMEPDEDPAMVHVALYLNNTCHDASSTLYAVRGVIAFDQLFNGDPNETNADERLSSGVFDVMVADPRRQPPGGGPIAEENLSRVTGWFRFYFERGQPAQPFP